MIVSALYDLAVRHFMSFLIQWPFPVVQFLTGKVASSLIIFYLGRIRSGGQAS